jgi:signal transduction histidine kinase
MFSQLGQPAERGTEGLGIGLALVRGLLELHGGAIQASSAGLGQGSEFIVRLPLAPVESSNTDPPLTDRGPTGTVGGAHTPAA